MTKNITCRTLERQSRSRDGGIAVAAAEAASEGAAFSLKVEKDSLSFTVQMLPNISLTDIFSCIVLTLGMQKA